MASPQVAQVLLRIKKVRRGDNFCQCNFATRGQTKVPTPELVDVVRKDAKKKITAKVKKSGGGSRPMKVTGRVTIKKGGMMSKKSLNFAYIFDTKLAYMIALRSIDNDIEYSERMLTELDALHLAKTTVACEDMRDETGKDMITEDGDWKGRLDYDWHTHMRVCLKDLDMGVTTGITKMRVTERGDAEEPTVAKAKRRTKPKKTSSASAAPSAERLQSPTASVASDSWDNPDESQSSSGSDDLGTLKVGKYIAASDTRILSDDEIESKRHEDSLSEEAPPSEFHGMSVVSIPPPPSAAVDDLPPPPTVDPSVLFTGPPVSANDDGQLPPPPPPDLTALAGGPGSTVSMSRPMVAPMMAPMGPPPVGIAAGMPGSGFDSYRMPPPPAIGVGVAGTSSSSQRFEMPPPPMVGGSGYPLAASSSRFDPGIPPPPAPPGIGGGMADIPPPPAGGLGAPPPNTEVDSPPDFQDTDSDDSW